MLKKLRLYFTLTVLSLGLALPASAASVSNTPTLQHDLAFAFGEDNTKLDNSSLSLLTEQEMMDTEGEWGPWGAFAGAGLGAWSYLGSSAGSGSFSWRRLAFQMGSGAAIGALSGPIGLGRYYHTSRAGGALGFTGGYGSRRGWW